MQVKLIDYMGSDLTVVNAARVSFHKESSLGWYDEDNNWVEDYEGSLSEKDQKLINYLVKHNHWSPFSHVQITMREKVPIFIARQRFKHMVGFTYNEVSRRYVDEEPEFYAPKKWRKKAEDKKQGSSSEEFDVESIDLEIRLSCIYRDIEDLYSDMITEGLAPEQARMILPQSMYTEYIVTGSLAAWARAYKLRSEETAQVEIQELAKQWDEVISGIKGLEYSWRALTND